MLTSLFTLECCVFWTEPDVRWGFVFWFKLEVGWYVSLLPLIKACKILLGGAGCGGLLVLSPG